MKDSEYMELALMLAKNGLGWTAPNPMVGAVLVKDGEIIGQGWHEYIGGPHAERNALRNCTDSPEGATLYVTLEPCCHYGKTPPCTEAIIRSGIAKVVIGTLDPNPVMAGKSVEILQNHQIQVEVGVLEEDCKRLIKVFSKFITSKIPFVLMKYAMTMDGKIATYTNHSKWITGEEARQRVQQTRHEFSAIMVGVNTIIYDNPLLTCRLENGRNPARIICDTHLRTPLDANVVQTAGSDTTFLATCSKDEEKRKQYLKKNCVLLDVGEKDGHIDLTDLMADLGNRNIDSVLLEGGSTLNWSALDQKIVDEAEIYIAPKLFGGTASTPVGGKGVAFPKEAFQLKASSVSQIGEDFLIESEVIYPCLQES